MKRVISISALLLFCISVGSAQTADEKKDPVGKWKFDAPYAPEGYTTGTVEIGLIDQKYSVIMTFTNLGFSLTGEKIATRNDSIFFLVWVEDTDVNVDLKIEDYSKMTGNAVYIEGTVPLTLTREAEQKQQ